MRRLAQVVVVLVAFGLFGGALYLQQQDATIDCASGKQVVLVSGAPASTQLQGADGGFVTPEQFAKSVLLACDRRRAAAESRDHLELAAVGAAALLAAGWLALRRPRGSASDG
jgi:hypothetical protein